MGGLYNEGDAIGFIRLFGLPMKVEALLRGKTSPRRLRR